MKQGDVYLRKEDNRLYAVAMVGVCLASGDESGSEMVILRPIKIIDGEYVYYAEYFYKLEGNNYDYQYNLYDGIAKEDVEE